MKCSVELGDDEDVEFDIDVDSDVSMLMKIPSGVSLSAGKLILGLPPRPLEC